MLCSLMLSLQAIQLHSDWRDAPSYDWSMQAGRLGIVGSAQIARSGHSQDSRIKQLICSLSVQCLLELQPAKVVFSGQVCSSICAKQP